MIITILKIIWILVDGIFAVSQVETGDDDDGEAGSSLMGRVHGDDSSSDSIGPPIPQTSQRKLADEEEEDEDVIGPMPPPPAKKGGGDDDDDSEDEEEVRPLRDCLVSYKVIKHYPFTRGTSNPICCVG